MPSTIQGRIFASGVAKLVSNGLTSFTSLAHPALLLPTNRLNGVPCRNCARNGTVGNSDVIAEVAISPDYFRVVRYPGEIPRRIAKHRGQVTSSSGRLHTQVNGQYLHEKFVGTSARTSAPQVTSLRRRRGT